MEQIAEVIKDYLREQKETKKKQKYYKILDKHNIREEQDLPDWVQDKLREAKSGAEYERVISGYLRFVQLHKLMKQEKLTKYIDHKICHNFIYQTDKTIKLEQIPSIIRFMLNKKNLISCAVKTYSINVLKYSHEISQYINSFEPESQAKSITHFSNDDLPCDDLDDWWACYCDGLVKHWGDPIYAGCNCLDPLDEDCDFKNPEGKPLFGEISSRLIQFSEDEDYIVFLNNNMFVHFETPWVYYWWAPLSAPWGGYFSALSPGAGSEAA